MHTEAEAKEKWCPREDLCINCIASKCMAWRPGYPKMNEQGEMIPTGYCGLAGAPTR